MKQCKCTKCQATLPIEAETSYLACTNCYAYFKVIGDEVELLTKFNTGNRPMNLSFELGQEITINQTVYRITGLVQRNDAIHTTFFWREYFLKNNIGETVFLNEYNGNWLLVRPLYDYHTDAKWESVVYEDIRYTLFQEYYQDVNWASGSFDFDITDVKKLYSREFIAPPQMLINEVRKRDVEQNSEWFIGEYVDEQQVFDEFNRLGNSSINTLSFPLKRGVGATEPYKSKLYFKEALNISLAALAVLLAVQLVFLMIVPEKKVLDETFFSTDLTYDSTTTMATTQKPMVSKTFEVKKTSKIAIELNTQVDNSWLESNITMVNEQTGAELPIVLGAEYYHGVEGGESWNEGNTRVSKDYSSVPAGKYHLLIETSTPKKENGAYTIRLKVGGMYFSNLLIMLVLISLVPIYLYFTEREFEKQRWADSDYSPYISEEEDE